MNPFAGRIERFRRALDERGWIGALLTPGGDAEYLTGIRRSRPNATESHMHGDWLAGVLVTGDSCIIIAPHLAKSRLEEMMGDKPWINELMHIPEGADLEHLTRHIVDHRLGGPGTLAVPRKGMAQTILELSTLYPEMEFANTGTILEPMRAVKDAGEIEAMRKAAAVADRAFAEVVTRLVPGMTEVDIKMEVERQLFLGGAEGTSFVTGIMIRGQGCDGPLEGVSRGADHRLEPGRVLAFDFGAVVDGYASDFGRTVFIGDPDPELQRIHELIIAAQAEGMRALVPGTPAEDVDARARAVIEEAGYGEAFFHRLGHGIGIDVHEWPFLSPGSTATVRENMCFTVEPSILIPGRCFVRVEDVVLVTGEGGVSLNSTDREPVVI